MDKEITNIPGMQPTDVVILRKFGYKSMKKIRNLININVETSSDGKTVEKPSFKFGDLQMAFFIHGIRSAPFFKEKMSDTEKYQVVDSDDFDTRIVDFLYPTITEMNNAETLQGVKKN